MSQRPLSNSAVDAELFVDRDRELSRLQRAVQLGFNVLVLGEPGVGVTSLVNQLAARVVENGTRARYVNASRASTVGELIDELETSLRALHLSDAHALHSDLDRQLGDEPSVGMRLLGALAAVGQMNEGERAADAISELQDEARRKGDLSRSLPSVVIVVDEAHDPEVVHGLFGRLRDELWELPFTWVVCGDERYRSAYLEPPADAFFDDVLHVEPLDHDAAAELLSRRLEHVAESDQPDVERLRGHLARLVDTANGSPRRLLAAAREVLLTPPGETEDRFRAAVRLQNEVSRQFGRAASMLVAELEALGPSSASDPELLRRLGWTRGRAAQVLRELEEAGIVTASTDREPDRPGRPRKLYRLNYDAFMSDEVERAS
ncbi:MAG TPA: ATP-binding protein [Nitriliruptorales bacterium]